MPCPYPKTIDRAIEIKVGHGNPTEDTAKPPRTRQCRVPTKSPDQNQKIGVQCFSSQF